MNRPVLEHASRRLIAAGPDAGRVAVAGLVMGCLAVLRDTVLHGMFPPALFWGAEGFLACLAALGLIIVAERLAAPVRGKPPAPGWQARPDARQFLDAFVYEDGLPALEEAALEEAAALYGPGARLEVVRMGQVDTSHLPREGRFCAHVLVRCLDFEEVPA